MAGMCQLELAIIAFVQFPFNMILVLSKSSKSFKRVAVVLAGTLAKE